MMIIMMMILMILMMVKMLLSDIHDMIVKNMMIVLHDFHDDFDDGGCYQMPVIDRDLRGSPVLGRILALGFREQHRCLRCKQYHKSMAFMQ